MLSLSALNPVLLCLSIKKPKAIQLNDYRPAGLTSVVIKDLERLVLTFVIHFSLPLTITDELRMQSP